MATNTPWNRITKLAGQQHGVFTAAQAAAKDIHPQTLARWLKAGRVKRWYPGVYAIAGAPDGWLRRARAATFAVDDSVLANDSAAHVLGLRDRAPKRITLLVPRGRGHRRGSLRIRSTLTLPDGHTTEAHRIPTTTVARTCVDLAADDLKVMRETYLNAWRRKLTAPDEVARVLAEMGRVRGAASVQALVAESDPQLARARSLPEMVGYLAITAADLLAPVINHPVRVGERRFELDYAWPGRLRALEVDGEQWHSTGVDVAADRVRQEELEGAGWRIDRVPAKVVLADEAEFLRCVRALLDVPVGVGTNSRIRESGPTSSGG